MGIKTIYCKSLMICNYFYVNVGVFVEKLSTDIILPFILDKINKKIIANFCQ